ncbi:MAG TPA: hypothetical protein VGL71_13650, partial [Urbifossiella sp.]
MQPIAPAGSIEPAALLHVEKVDLSAVKFAPEPAAGETIEVPAEPQPETARDAEPLLDLIAESPQEIALEVQPAPGESVSDELSVASEGVSAKAAPEPAPIETKGRKPRAPRKKAVTRRVTRKKKGEDVQAAVEAIAATTDELQPVAPVAQIAAVESPAEAPIGLEAIAPAPSEVDRPIEPVETTARFESLEQPVIAQASAEEVPTQAFYSGPAEEVPLVSVDMHSDPQVIDPGAEPSLASAAQENAEPEILSFAAAATTPEAQDVMAAWHGAEIEPVVSEPQSPSRLFDSLDEHGDITVRPPLAALPEPGATTSDVADIETSVAEPSVSEPAPDVMAWAHEEAVSLDVPAPPAPARFEPAAADAGVETIENTEPTVESALDLEPSLPPTPVAAPAPDLVDIDTTLTDTAFGRAVNDFSGSGLGPLVEEATASPRSTLGVSEPSDSFDAALSELPEFAAPESANGEDEEYLDAELLDAEIFEAKANPVEVAAAELSLGLPGEIPAPDHTLTAPESHDHLVTVDASTTPADFTLTSAHEIDVPVVPPEDDDAEFLPLGDDALIEPLEFDEPIADELPGAVEVEAPPVEAQPMPPAAAQTPAPIVNEATVPAPA